MTGRDESPIPGSSIARLAQASEMPGPGYYNIQEASNVPVGESFYDDGNYMLKLNESKKRQLSSFQSTTQRDPPAPKDKLDPNMPGPGTYTLPPAAINIPKSASSKNFNTTDTRFRDVMIPHPVLIK